MPLSSDEYDEACRIFHDALDIREEERQAFLERECLGQPEIRYEVESLLALDPELSSKETDFLDEIKLPQSPHLPNTKVSSKGDAPPVIGNYRLLDTLGEGGMGTVYLAEQEKPIRRRVALKLIKLGMDTREVVARFEAERQALALMNHPSIASVYEAGSTDDGRPYFTMEMVRGVPITTYCDRHRLSLRQRLELVVQVCRGVEHAHHQGIIHRDLKPSNILVTTPDEGPIAKIIDFGVAKATNQRLTEKTLYTELGRTVGTPQYMSPEQAEYSAEEIDHRTDIYSLGVVLYELLVGELPLDREALSKAALDEVLRRIREDDPPTPSTRWSRLNMERTSKLAASRRMSSSAVRSELRGDLDWIVMAALEKDRERRYRTAAQLEEDIRRYLDGEPVHAGPPSLSYRVKKYVVKHRAAVLSVGAVILALLVGLVGTRWFAIAASKNAEHARQSEASARVSQARAVNMAKDVLRLADGYDVQLLEEEAETLWPASSTIVDKLEDWLHRAQPLTEKLAKHRETLAQLEAEALPWDYLSRAADRKNHPEFPVLVMISTKVEELEKQLLELKDEGSLAEMARRVEALKRKRQALEQKVGSTRLTWRFADTEESTSAQKLWWHVRLSELIRGLDHLALTVTSVRKRLSWAQTIRERSVEGPLAKKLWEEAITSIANETECPMYTGLRIDPQEGLIPIGRDPTSGLWEFCHRQTGDVPERDPSGNLILKNPMGLVFVLLPGGTFEMGAVRSPLQLRFRKDGEELRIEEIPDGSFARRFGLQEKDVVVGVNDQKGVSADVLERLLRSLRAGKRVSIAVRRNGKPTMLSGTLPQNIDTEARVNEGPPHHVTLDAFFMSKFEMTQAQWQHFTEENPSIYGPDTNIGGKQHTLLHPVENVSWDDCDPVLRKLGLVLPTEAQWEYAARGGTTTAWWTGDSRLSLRHTANVADQSAGKAGFTWPGVKDLLVLVDGYAVHVPVGTFPANKFGLHEVAGNIWELCRDWYGEYGVTTVAKGDGERQVKSAGLPTRVRVNRGGCFSASSERARSAKRDTSAPSTRSRSMGVRPARVISGRQ